MTTHERKFPEVFTCAITVVTRSERSQIEPYLYPHTTVVEPVRIGHPGFHAFILETVASSQSEAEFLANYQAARLSSGLHGARVHSGPNMARHWLGENYGIIP